MRCPVFSGSSFSERGAPSAFSKARGRARALRTSLCRRLRAGGPAIDQASFTARGPQTSSSLHFALGTWKVSAFFCDGFLESSGAILGKTLPICFRACAKKPLRAAFTMAFLASNRKDSTRMVSASTCGTRAACKAAAKLPLWAAQRRICLAF
eukprot:Skav214347  [mRNA]  locus=scaffold86:438395:438853:- [translate_table: standard]